MVEIRNDVPMPERVAAVKWPFADLARNDSFLMPGSTIQNASSLCTYWRNKFKGKREFTARTVDEGARVWRVK
jgi:hypothetical protein